MDTKFQAVLAMAVIAVAAAKIVGKGFRFCVTVLAAVILLQVLLSFADIASLLM